MRERRVSFLVTESTKLHRFIFLKGEKDVHFLVSVETKLQNFMILRKGEKGIQFLVSGGNLTFTLIHF